MPKINELKKAFEDAGANVQNIEDKRQNMAIKLGEDPDAYTAEDLQTIKDEFDKASKVRDFANEALETARAAEIANMSKDDIKPLDNKEKNLKDEFVKNFKGMIDPIISAWRCRPIPFLCHLAQR